jgi:hypothetical protein
MARGTVVRHLIHFGFYGKSLSSGGYPTRPV